MVVFASPVTIVEIVKLAHKIYFLFIGVVCESNALLFCLY